MPTPLEYRVRGKKAYQFKLRRPDSGKRTTLRLGVVSKKIATEVGLRIDNLLACIKYRSTLEPDLVAWLSTIDEKLYARFVACGLLMPRAASTVPNMEKFITDYCNHQVATAGWKDNSLGIRTQCKKDLVTFFGLDSRFSDVTAAKADEWFGWLQKAKPDGRGLGRITASKRVRDAKQFFAHAKRHKLIVENPFEGIRTSSEANPDRMMEVPRDDVERLLKHIQHPELKLIVALGRFAGLRAPSEPSALRWADVDFEGKTLTIRASKTEHLADHGIRTCPLFEDLVPYFLAVKPEGAKPSDFVLSELHGAKKNHRPQMLAALKQANLKPWPRLFHNMRANAITDLADRYSLAQVCKWVGNSIDVAMKHYVIIRNREYTVPGPADATQSTLMPSSKSGTKNGTVSPDQGGSAGSSQ